MPSSTPPTSFNRILSALFLLALIACAAFAHAQNAPAASSPDRFTFAPKPGPYPVGFRFVFQYDYTRSFTQGVDMYGKPATGERARPVQTLIWYPAVKSSNAPMVFGDYLPLSVRELEAEPTIGAAPMLAESRQEYGDAVNDKTLAVKDATPAQGSFPVVIYAPSFSAPAFENSDMLEYLASNGYIVLSSADIGAHSRPMTPDLEGIEAQRGDISFLIGYAHTLPQADMSHIAVAGFSWGGISNLFAAARDSRIGALISLDGSARYFPKLIVDSGYVHPEEMTLPVLFFRNGGMSLEDADQQKQTTAGPDFLNELTHADLYDIHMYWMQHGDFSSTLQRDPAHWQGGRRDVDFTRSDANESYSWVARYILNFLNAYFKQDAAAQKFLKNTPIENGAPAHLFNVDFRAASGIAPTFIAFEAEVGKRGFDHIDDVYTAFKAANPDFKFDQGVMTNWGSGFVWFQHYPEAIAVFKLDCVIFPNEVPIYLQLADAYAKNGQKELAIASYEKALSIRPDNPYIKGELEKLKNPAPAKP